VRVFAAALVAATLGMAHSPALALQTPLVAIVPAGVEVELELPAINSKTAVRGGSFVIKLAEPVTLNGRILMPAGSTGAGEIVHGERARGMGKPGELILAARYLEVDGRKVALRGLKVGSMGKDATTDALVVSFIAGPLVGFMKGGEVDVPAGTRARAVVSADVSFDFPAAPIPEPKP